MKIYLKSGRYIKTVPRKYAIIPNLPDYFEDIDHVRLSCSEYKILDLALFAVQNERFICRLQLLSEYNYEKIRKSSPLRAFEVTTSDGQLYYSLQFRNGYSVRCPKDIYNQCPVKDIATFPSENVAPPKLIQLTLF